MARKKRVRNDGVDVVNKPKRVKKAIREDTREEDPADDNWLGGLGMSPEDFWRFLACKVIPKPRGGAATARAPNTYKADVTKEVRLHKQISNYSHIVSFMAACENADFVYLVTKFCNQGELPAYLPNKTTVSEKHIADFFYQLIEAILHLHTRGIVHRDIKPSNILVHEHTLMLADLGLADYDRGEFGFDVRVGTVAYSAPEVLRRCYGAAADIYGACIHGSQADPLLMARQEVVFPADAVISRGILESTRVSFTDPIFKKIGGKAVGLLRRMLSFDALSRPSAAAVLRDPFLTQRDTLSREPLEGHPVKMHQLQLERGCNRKLLPPVAPAAQVALVPPAAASIAVAPVPVASAPVANSVPLLPMAVGPVAAAPVPMAVGPVPAAPVPMAVVPVPTTLPVPKGAVPSGVPSAARKPTTRVVKSQRKSAKLARPVTFTQQNSKEKHKKAPADWNMLPRGNRKGQLASFQLVPNAQLQATAVAGPVPHVVPSAWLQSTAVARPPQESVPVPGGPLSKHHRAGVTTPQHQKAAIAASRDSRRLPAIAPSAVNGPQHGPSAPAFFLKLPNPLRLHKHKQDILAEGGRGAKLGLGYPESVEERQ